MLGADGWLRTGDIAEIDAEGFVKITDRKKDIIVTAGGKNVAPQNLENDLKSSKFVSQAMVVGDKQPYIAALITLDPETLPPGPRGGASTDMESLAVAEECASSCRASSTRSTRDRSRYEQIKRFEILPRDFTMEDDELTPTLKLKRRVVQHFDGSSTVSTRARRSTRRPASEPTLRWCSSTSAHRGGDVSLRPRYSRTRSRRGWRS